ncbi:hypothetical protein OESDEN_25476 [Oesophagostomum dentatum]|uniref:ShKT domain-containing protein n=1 Tax=Oesophagostomum dentatum TaxID=61180 RepID=A0A0B1RPC7_OESDE|nr:hypothetical protein OESDEN_25476 [Oesophagostomum dentatum]
MLSQAFVAFLILNAFTEEALADGQTPATEKCTDKIPTVICTLLTKVPGSCLVLGVLPKLISPCRNTCNSC